MMDHHQIRTAYSLPDSFILQIDLDCTRQLILLDAFYSLITPYVSISSSLYTTFLIHMFPLSSSSGPKTHRFSSSPHREKATYSCPCENTSSWRYTPTLLSVRPCALLIVIAKATRRGSWHLWRWKEPMAWSSWTRLMSISLPALGP